MTDQVEPTASAAASLLDKLGAFSRGLEPAERALLGALLAPGVAQALSESDEVAGYGLVGFELAALPAVLAEALRDHGVTVSGL